MSNFDYITKDDIKEHNPNWPEIPDHPEVLDLEKANALLNLINHEPDIDKTYLYAKEVKYQLRINKRESTGLNYFNDSKAKNNEKLNILIIFDDRIVDTLTNKKLNPIGTELFIRGRKLDISLLFITQSYFAVPKNSRLNSTHYFVMKISSKRELQQISFNNSSDIDFQDFMNLYKKCTSKPYSFLVIDTTLASDSSSPFRKNLLERISN